MTKRIMNQCFKKVKNVDKPNAELNYLYNKGQILRTKTDDESKVELIKLNKKFCEKYSESMYKKIEQVMVCVSSQEAGRGCLNQNK